jgi:hypothetical protein
MRNGTFNTSNCRGKLQKMGMLYTHSPKSPGPFSKLPKKIKLNKKNSKQGTVWPCVGVDLRPALARQPRVGDQRSGCGCLAATSPRLLVVGSPATKGC